MATVHELDALPAGFRNSADFSGERREALRLAAPDGHWLGATLHQPPEGVDVRAAALLLPGWSGPRTGPAELLVFLARGLALSGRAALRLDFHGRGDSSGAFGECDLDRMIAGASLGLDLLRQRFPSAELTAGGICSGGNVALGLASLRPADVRAVIALSALPFQPARSAAFDRRRRWRNLKQYLAKAARPATWLRLLRGEVNVSRVSGNLSATEQRPAGERNLKDSARDIERELRAWQGRALFVWGGGDEEAAPAEAHFRKLHAAGCGSQAVFHTVAGANHNFYQLAWRREVLDQALAFLAAR